MTKKNLSLFKSVFYSFTLLLFAVVLQACGGEKKLARVSDNATILAFGDSLTFGVGTDKKYSYPSVLSNISGKTVVNAGISGEITEDGLARLGKVIDKSNPELMILLEGGNDILRNHNLSQTKKNLTAMINLAREKGVQVVLLGVPEKKLFSNVAPLYRELAGEHQVVFDGELIANLLYERSYKSDSVHFNKTGYQKMAEAIHELLIDNGAL